MKTLWKSKDLNELNKASMEMWQNCLELASKEEIEFENYRLMGEIQI